MIIDMHAHVVAPPELYAYKAGLLSHRGAHGKGNPGVPATRIEEFAQQNIAIMDSVGTDVQFISPRPFQGMHSEKPGKIVLWWAEAVHNVIAEQVRNHPDRFQGVCQLPLLAGEPVTVAIPELERCVNELGFIGCLLNPDPSEGAWTTPTLDNEYWYPLYEKLCELDVPALIHSAGCKNERETYSEHFITEETIAVLSLCKSQVFQRFPTLKIIVAHGGGSVPYQIGRWRAARFNQMRNNPNLESFDQSLRRLYFDTVLYNKESLEFLFKIVGTDRCMFGTEKPGSGSAQDPATGAWLDDLKPVIESIEWLTEQDKRLIFEENAKKVFTRFKMPAKV
jgi:predicted TIM-barrel fold metal-dependent hydrolase